MLRRRQTPEAPPKPAGRGRAPRSGRIRTPAPAVQILETTTGSILTADVGSVHTRVNLFDLVDGQYRLVSRAQALTTAAPPAGDVGVGLRRALQQMTELIGREFVLPTGEIRVGGLDAAADVFLATASGGRPMRAVLVGLMPDVSLASGRRALASTYVELVDTLSLADYRTVEQQVNDILRNEPDLILIVGGTDFGATAPMLELLNTVRLAALLARDPKPAVLYAGNDGLRQTVHELLGDEVSLYLTDNVRPNLETEQAEPVQLELSMVYGDFRARTSGGFEEVQRLSELGVWPGAQCYGNVVRYLGEMATDGAGVLCVDVGSSTVTVCASVNKQTHVTIRPDLGLGHSAISGVEAVGVRSIQRWLTFPATDDDILDYAWNKTLRPATVPMMPRELEIEYAIARELIHAAVATSRAGWRGVPEGELLPAMRPIIGAGALLAQPINPGIGALLLLDALQPVGVVELKLDPYSVMAALGVIAYLEPHATVQVLESGGLLALGTAICPLGRLTSGTAMQVSVKYPGGRTLDTEVEAGTLKRIALAAGQKAQVTLNFGRGLSLNGRRRVTLTLEGGAAGLILDGRGRPLSPPRDVERRAATLPKWYSAVQHAE